jgi:hypothetical protein
MFGLNIDPNNSRGNPEPTELRELGVQIVRYTFYDSSGGDQVDSGKVRFYTDKARGYREAGIDSLVILTYDTYPGRPNFDASDHDWDEYLNRFTRRAGQIAQRLAPWRPAYQIWNEPDHPVKGNYNPTLREEVFGRMLRRTRDAIKAADASARVICGGLAMGNPSWLRRVVDSLGGEFPVDATAFHPYGQRPDRGWPRPDWGFGYVGDLLNQYYQAGQRKPIWISEMGVKEEDVENNREMVAEFLNRYYRTITTQFSDKVQQLIWFCYSDGMVPTFGLLDANGNRKPAYFAYVRAASSYQPQPAEPSATEVTPPPPPGVSTPFAPPPVTEIPSPAPPSVPLSEPPVPSEIPATPSGSGVPAAEFQQLAGQVSNLQRQMQQQQGQLSQIQTQLQQLFNRQVELQGQIQQLQPQPATSSGPFAPPPPVTPIPASRPAPLIQNVTNQLKHHPTLRFPTRPLQQIQRIVIHHTAIPPHIGAERVAEHRVDKQGWPGIGYHYFITGDGQIQQTNELTTQSTHAGQYDPIAIGVCFAGDFTSVSPSSAQIEAGAQLIAWLLAQLGLSIQAVIGYKEVVNTQSPGLQWDSGQRWGDQLKARIQAYL